MLGLRQTGASLTYQNVEQRGFEFIRWTLLPWTVRLERALTALLPRPQYVKFNTSSFLRADTAARYAAYSVGIGSKFLLPDEVREKEDLPPLPDGMGKTFPAASTPAASPPSGPTGGEPAQPGGFQ